MNPWLLPCERRPARSPDLGKQSETASHQGKRVLNVSHHFALFLNLSRPKRGPGMRTVLTLSCNRPSRLASFSVTPGVRVRAIAAPNRRAIRLTRCVPYRCAIGGLKTRPRWRLGHQGS